MLVVAPGDYGKPRPGVVVQSDRLAKSGSVIVCLVTGTIRDAPAVRIVLEPTAETGLRQRSQIMVDKLFTVPRDKCGPRIGQIEDTAIAELDGRLAFILGLAESVR